MSSTDKRPYPPNRDTGLDVFANALRECLGLAPIPRPSTKAATRRRDDAYRFYVAPPERFSHRTSTRGSESRVPRWR
jgi:hypothetical protein